MLKKFFVSMLGTIAGIWISLVLAFFVVAGIVGALIASGSDSKTKIGNNSVLYIDLSGGMPDRYQPADIWQLLRDSSPDGESLVDILDAVRAAADDDKIEGIYIDAAGSGAGIAAREEIVEALGEFKQSGKWIYAYADNYTQGDYLIASAADSVFLNPSGNLDVHGVASQVPFFTGLLDKLGVKMQIVRVGTYKSAVEPFMTTDMSEPSRLQTQVMVDSIWDYMNSTIASNRGVSRNEVNTWADSLIMCWDSQQTLASGAVTSMKYRRIVEDALREKLGLGRDEDLPLIYPSEYLESRKAADADRPHIAVYFASGDIVDSGEGGIVGENVVPDIIDLADDDNVEALVLRVNSGGGSAFASEQIWEALQYFKSTGKPFYVSMGDMAASGGYYISCGADKIYADHTTLTGSIGVFGMIPDFSGLVTDKLGVNIATVESNPNAAFPAVTGKMNPYQLMSLQNSVNNMYDLFTSRVADGRGLSQDSVKVMAQGRVWTGGAALRIGLVDEIGSLNTVIGDIADECGLSADKVVQYPFVKDEFLTQVIMEARRNISVGNVRLDARMLRTMQLLNTLSTQNPVQARMPMFVVE